MIWLIRNTSLTKYHKPVGTNGTLRPAPALETESYILIYFNASANFCIYRGKTTIASLQKQKRVNSHGRSKQTLLSLARQPRTTAPTDQLAKWKTKLSRSTAKCLIQEGRITGRLQANRIGWTQCGKLIHMLEYSPHWYWNMSCFFFAAILTVTLCLKSTCTEVADRFPWHAFNGQKFGPGGGVIEILSLCKVFEHVKLLLAQVVTHWCQVR